MEIKNQNDTKEKRETENPKLQTSKGPYILGEKLGEGAFAKVRLATQIHIKEKCAIKIIDKKFLHNTKDIDRIQKEIKILKKIRHKNIIQLLDIMESKKNLYFVMEYCPGGELFDYLVQKKRLKEEEACIFFQEIINGVEYLHEQGIIHRDLKLENILLDDNNHIKITDFGLSSFYSKNAFLLTACGTPSYASPEMLEGHKYNGESTDVWSCGIILYAMLCGSLPFSESKEEIIVKKIKIHDYKIPDYLSEDAKNLLNSILVINPKHRINIEHIKQHPWFNLIKPHLMKGINFDENIIPVDDKILDMVKSYGFDAEECRKFLLKNKFCSLTAIYYLCLKRYIRENGKSISDLESDLFEEYINDPKNKIIKEKENEEKESNKIKLNEKDDKEPKADIKRGNIIKLDSKESCRKKGTKKEIKNQTQTSFKKSEKKKYLKTTKNSNNQSLLTGHSKNNKNKIIKKDSNKVSNIISLLKKNKHVDDGKMFKKNISSHKMKRDNKKTIKDLFISNANTINTEVNIHLSTNNTNKKNIKLINTINMDKNHKKPNFKSINIDTEKRSLKNKNLRTDFTNNNDKKISNNSISNVNIINININNPKENNQNISTDEFSKIIKELWKMNKVENKNHLFKSVDENKKYEQNNNNNTNNLFQSMPTNTNTNELNNLYNILKNYPISQEINFIPNHSFPNSNLIQNFSNEFQNMVIMEEKRPLSVINYIAKKLVTNSFCGNSHCQPHITTSFISNLDNNQIINNSSFKTNSDDSNIIINNDSINNDNIIPNEYSNVKNESLTINEDNNNNNYSSNSFNTLICLLNQKFRKYISKEKLNKIEKNISHNDNLIKKPTNRKTKIIKIEKKKKSIDLNLKDDKKNKVECYNPKKEGRFQYRNDNGNWKNQVSNKCNNQPLFKSFLNNSKNAKTLIEERTSFDNSIMNTDERKYSLSPMKRNKKKIKLITINNSKSKNN